MSIGEILAQLVDAKAAGKNFRPVNGEGFCSICERWVTEEEPHAPECPMSKGEELLRGMEELVNLP